MKHFVVAYRFGAPSNSVGYVISYHKTSDNALSAWETFRDDFVARNRNAYLKGGVYQVEKRYKKREYVYTEYVIRDLLEAI